jgi:hypothetical protein
MDLKVRAPDPQSEKGVDCFCFKSFSVNINFLPQVSITCLWQGLCSIRDGFRTFSVIV